MKTAPAHPNASADASIIFNPDRQPLQPISPSHRPQPTPQQLTVALQVNELAVTTRPNRIRTQEQPQPGAPAPARRQDSTSPAFPVAHVATRRAAGARIRAPALARTDGWRALESRPAALRAEAVCDQITAADTRPTGA